MHSGDRSFYTSSPALRAEPPQPIPGPTVPITALAQRGSNQFSLEQPQNKAGALRSLFVPEDGSHACCYFS